MTQLIPEFEYPSRSRRLARVLAYFLWAVSGIILISNPSGLINTSLTGAIVYVWSIFIMLGGISSFLGSITDRWIGEYVGLPMVISSVWLYGGLFIFAGTFTYVKLAVGLLFISFGLKALGRWQDIRDLVDAHRKSIKLKGQDGDAE